MKRLRGDRRGLVSRSRSFHKHPLVRDVRDVATNRLRSERLSLSYLSFCYASHLTDKLGGRRSCVVVIVWTSGIPANRRVLWAKSAVRRVR